MDRSVRYPITTPRPNCGGGQAGVHTIYAFANQTGYPDEHSRYDAYCFKGITELKKLLIIDIQTQFSSAILLSDLLPFPDETEGNLNVTSVIEEYMNKTIISVHKFVPGKANGAPDKS